MTTLARAALSLSLASWLAVSTAHAAEPTPPDGEAAANALVEQAAHAYDQNQLDQALDLLTRAYALSPRPSILYNRAQVLRAQDDCAGALNDYRQFLETTTADDPNRERALRRRDEMQACADQRNPPALAHKPAAPPAVVLPEPPPVLLTTPAPPDHPHDDQPAGHRRAMRAGGWALIGVGVLAAGAAAVLAWEAHDNQTQLNQYLSSHPDLFRWTGQPKSLYEDGRNDATAAQWCGAVAALAGAGGAALLIISRPPASTDGPVAASGPRTTLVGWSGRF